MLRSALERMPELQELVFELFQINFCNSILFIYFFYIGYFHLLPPLARDFHYLHSLYYMGTLIYILRCNYQDI